MTNIDSKELELAKSIALAAGEIMLKYFDGDQQVKIKEDNSDVTIADTTINRMVIDELTKEFPDDGIIGEEESTSEYGMGRKWICDPIDGTAGYVWGTPTAMFSLALVIDGKPIMGIVYDPFLKRMYEAIKDRGSFCNGKRLLVSNKPLNKGTVAITSNVQKILKLNYIERLLDLGTRLAPFSGAVNKSCLVARGKFEGYVENGVNAHDMAAIHVIVEEAGGKIASLTGKELDYSRPFKGAIVSNGLVHEELVKIVNEN